MLALAPGTVTNVPFRDLTAVSIDVPVFLGAALGALLVGALAGIIPALSVLPAQPADVLRETGGRSGTGRRGRRLRSALIAGEVALALIVMFILTTTLVRIVWLFERRSQIRVLSRLPQTAAAHAPEAGHRPEPRPPDFIG